MAANTHELALRYLLELSVDIHAAALIDDQGALVAAAPSALGGRTREVAQELATEVRGLSEHGSSGGVELDASCEDGSVFVIRERGMAMICVTGRAVLPGLIFHDMHAVLNDLDRAAGEGLRRTPAASGSQSA